MRKELHNRYKELLLSYSEELRLERSIKLLSDVLCENPQNVTPLEAILAEIHNPESILIQEEKDVPVVTPYQVPPGLSEDYASRLRELTKLEFHRQNQQAPSRRNPDTIRLQGFVKAVIYSMSACYSEECGDDDSQFLYSVASLIYSDTIEELIPMLMKKNMTAELEHIFQSLFAFTRNRCFPSTHRHWLRYQLLGVISGAEDIAIEELEQSVGASDFSHHDHISKIQALWLALLGKSEFQKMMRILLREYKSCPMKYVHEMDHMLERLLEHTISRSSDG